MKLIWYFVCYVWCNFTKINTPPRVFFTFFKLHICYQIAQRITYLIFTFTNCTYSFHDLSLYLYSKMDLIASTLAGQILIPITLAWQRNTLILLIKYHKIRKGNVFINSTLSLWQELDNRSYQCKRSVWSSLPFWSVLRKAALENLKKSSGKSWENSCGTLLKSWVWFVNLATPPLWRVLFW